MNPLSNSNYPPVVDITTPEPAPIHPDATYVMSLGLRQLIGSYVEANFGGDLFAACEVICSKLTPAQANNWDLHIKTAASKWADGQNEHQAITPGQLDASMYYLQLLQGTRQHENAAVNSALRGMHPGVRNALVQQFITMNTQGEFNRARKRLVTMVPNIVVNRSDRGAEEREMLSDGVLPEGMTDGSF